MIQFIGVTKCYTQELGFTASEPALEKLTFSLGRSQTLGLIGANGAGKSTSIRLLMDFIRPDQGTIQLFDQSTTSLSQRGHIGYLPEMATFPANLTVLDLIRFTGATCGMATRQWQERGEQLLRELGIWAARKKRLRTYSKGMQQRANFVLALLNDPDLLVLDEPMSGLDPIGRGQIIDLIQRLKAEGKTILFCSHILGDVDRLVDQLLVLHRGRMLFHGRPGELLAAQGAADIESAFLTLIAAHDGAGHA